MHARTHALMLHDNMRRVYSIVECVCVCVQAMPQPLETTRHWPPHGNLIATQRVVILADVDDNDDCDDHGDVDNADAVAKQNIVSITSSGRASSVRMCSGLLTGADWRRTLTHAHTHIPPPKARRPIVFRLQSAASKVPSRPGWYESKLITTIPQA